MIRQNIARIAVLTTTLLVAFSSPVAAGQWSHRTILTFSAPVKVPGATLPAGTYVFELLNPTSTMDVVKITDSDSSKVYSLTHAVPTIRTEPTEEVIVLFTPMDKGSMPALRGWYPSGGRHGHLFVYSAEEALSLADRSKSVVLSRDVVDSRWQAGTIMMVRPGGGAITPWKQDEGTQREWDAWAEDRRGSTTPMIIAPPHGQQEQVADIEDHPERYFGRILSLDGKVDEVYGPRLFELDEPDWGQPAGDVLVFVPEGSLAAVRENDRVTVTGTLKRFVRSDLLWQSRWMDVGGIMDRDLHEEPVLVATRIIGGDNDRALILTEHGLDLAAPAGTAAPVRDIAGISAGGPALVGRRVALPAVTIHSIDRDNGFFVRSGTSTVFVMVEDLDERRFRVGDSVMLEGVVLALPPTLAADLTMPPGATTQLYVYANKVTTGRQPS